MHAKMHLKMKRPLKSTEAAHVKTIAGVKFLSLADFQEIKLNKQKVRTKRSRGRNCSNCSDIREEHTSVLS